MIKKAKHYDLPEWIWRWLGPFIIAVVAIVGFVWSYGTWPDVLVDFGRELYVPWRLAGGEVLYRDIAWFFGPLSPYIIALWFYCFGVSLQSLVILNVLIIIGVLCLVYRIIFLIAGRTSAILSCLTFLSISAFAQFTTIGNYNWISPYSHGMTHGAALSLLSIYLLFLFVKSCRMVWIGGSGFILGLVFLTKPEIFLAALTGNIAGIVTMLWLKHHGWKFALQTFLIWTGLAILPITISYILFSLVMPSYDALHATMGSWPYVLNPGNTQLLFYKTTIGTFDLMGNIIIILKWVGWYALIFVPVGGLSLVCHRTKIPTLRIAVITFLLISSVLLLLWKWEMFTWLNNPRSWPVFLLLFGLIMLWKIIYRRYDCEEHPAVVLRFTMIVFSLVLLAKMILHVRISHYGFVLALPAALMVVVALWEWVPQFLKKHGGQPIVFRAAMLASWLVTIAAYVYFSDKLYDTKKYLVGTEADAFWSDPRGEYVSTALQVLSKQVKPGETLAVIPQGIMLNYQLRMKTPTPYMEFLPPTMMYYGDDKILASFKKHPPDWVVLIRQDNSEYGLRFFGKDYGNSLWEWIDKNYVFKIRIGSKHFNDDIDASPLQISSNCFGILIGGRKG